MQALYEENADFQRYVDRHCKEYKLTVEEALKEKLVQEVGKQYMEQSKQLGQCEVIRSEGYDYKATMVGGKS